MNHKPLDTFGQLVVQHLFDAGLNRYQALQSGQLKSPSTESLQSELQQFNEAQKALIKRLIVELMQTATHDFLFAVAERMEQEGDLELYANGSPVTDLTDGLQGELFGEQGWLFKFSEYRSDLES